MKWIKCNGRNNPTEYGNYLVIVQFYKGMKHTRMEVVEWYDEWKVNYEWTVTHWMPLPLPPKDGD